MHDNTTLGSNSKMNNNIKSVTDKDLLKNYKVAPVVTRNKRV